jgi:hypothetical protein
MRASDIVVWLAVAAGAVILIALDSKSKMTWFGVGLGVIALVVALYAGVELPALARWGR